jgi:hypothetical protein
LKNPPTTVDIKSEWRTRLKLVLNIALIAFIIIPVGMMTLVALWSIITNKNSTSAVSAVASDILPFYFIGTGLVFGVWAITYIRSALPVVWRDRCTTLILIGAGVSPVGFFVPYLAFVALGLCRGALGSGVRCDLWIFSDYFENLAVLFELSFFIVVGVLWALIAFAIWILLAARVVRALFSARI